MSIRAICIDDESDVLATLKIKLQEFCPQIELVGSANSSIAGFELISKLKPDLVFTDISMPGGSGFDLLRMFDQVDFEIIFVTAYDSFAIEAVSFCALGYLLKPIKNLDLIQAVQNVDRRMGQKLDRRRVDALLENSLNPESGSNKIGIPTATALEFVAVDDIIRCEGVNKLTSIQLKDRTKILSSYSIGVFKKMLSNYGFFLVHKSHLVNMKHLKRYQKDGMLVLSDDSVVPVSVRKRQSFLEAISRISNT